jgi:hypothetical protein
MATIPTSNGLYQILTTKAELSLKPKQVNAGKMANTEKQAEPKLARKPQPHPDKSRNHASTNSKNRINDAKRTRSISYKWKNVRHQKQTARNQIKSPLTNPGGVNTPSCILDEGEKGIFTQYPRRRAETETKAEIESKSDEAASMYNNVAKQTVTGQYNITTGADDATCNDEINIDNLIQHLMGNSKIRTKQGGAKRSTPDDVPAVGETDVCIESLGTPGSNELEGDTALKALPTKIEPNSRKFKPSNMPSLPSKPTKVNIVLSPTISKGTAEDDENKPGQKESREEFSRKLSQPVEVNNQKPPATSTKPNGGNYTSSAFSNDDKSTHLNFRNCCYGGKP